MTDAEIARGFAECRKCLRRGGVLIISVGDYAAIERRSPDVRPYGEHLGGRHRYTAEQVWEGDGDRYDVTLRLTDETSGEAPQYKVFRTRYYAVTIARLLEMLAAAGFARVERRDGAFVQPLVIGVAE